MVADDALKPPERNEAGTALNWVGDPRFREDFYFLPNDELLGFVHVPGGNFQMGSNDYDWEKPPHEVTLPEFFIARFPVTVAQFQAFVKATGERPGDESILKGPDNHPMVRVSWHEAMAYCRWLQTVLEASESPELQPIRECLAAGWRVRLPTEAEWERAARGTDGRTFPWGKKPDPNRANYDDSKIGSTSAVGCFPGGETPIECLDMSGNVWEWTVSLWGKDFSKPDFKYPYRHDEKWNNETVGNETMRVFRGGSFLSTVDPVRCANRLRSNPDLRYDLNGFRCCVSPNPTLKSGGSDLWGSGDSVL
jgi:formylglycine-generating enzyme required for sulfatase activity